MLEFYKMTFRFARHTNNLEQLKTFYTNVLGLEILCSFENHNEYDGVFIGKPYGNWHLEFTKSKDLVEFNFSVDDILVFYPHSKLEYEMILKKITQQNIPFIAPKNHYWKENGKMILDPDGYQIIISPLKI